MISKMVLRLNELHKMNIQFIKGRKALRVER